MEVWLSESAHAEIFKRRQTQHKPSSELGATSLPQTVHFKGASVSALRADFFLINLSAKLRF